MGMHLWYHHNLEQPQNNCGTRLEQKEHKSLKAIARRNEKEPKDEKGMKSSCQCNNESKASEQTGASKEMKTNATSNALNAEAKGAREPAGVG